ncbi:MAG: hypothetical protein ABMB14_06045 [Myxococcota bacterium]
MAVGPHIPSRSAERRSVRLDPLDPRDGIRISAPIDLAGWWDRAGIDRIVRPAAAVAVIGAVLLPVAATWFVPALVAAAAAVLAGWQLRSVIGLIRMGDVDLVLGLHALVLRGPLRLVRIPYAELTGATRDPDRIRLETRGGARAVWFPVAPFAYPEVDAALIEAVRRAGASGSPDDVPRSLGRGLDAAPGRGGGRESR